MTLKKNNLIVSAISNNPLCKDDSTWFRMLPLKALGFQVWIRYQYVKFENWLFLIGVLHKWLSNFTTEKHIIFKPKKRQYLPHYWSDKGFNRTVLNQVLPPFRGESLLGDLTEDIEH